MQLNDDKNDIIITTIIADIGVFTTAMSMNIIAANAAPRFIISNTSHLIFKRATRVISAINAINVAVPNIQSR